MKKILFIAAVESHILYFHIPFIKYFQSKGCEVHVATKLGNRKSELDQIKAICHDIDFSRSPYSLKNFGALKQLVKVMKSNEYSLIHVHTPTGAFLGRLAARLTKSGPVIYTAHGFHFYKGAPLLNWLVYYPMEKLASRWTDAIITMNDEDYFFAKSFERGRLKSIFNVHGVGVPIGQFDQDNYSARRDIKHKLGYGDDSILLLVVAELVKRKNHIQIIKAVKNIVDSGKNVHLLIVGDGKLESELKSLVSGWGLDKNIKFLGYRTDIPELLAASNVVLLTSKHEGLPKCIMEAMAAGKPVITTNVRGSRDLVKDGLNGFLVPLDDIDTTANAILKLIKDEELSKRMGSKGRDMIMSYSIENVLSEMDSIYKRYID